MDHDNTQEFSWSRYHIAGGSVLSCGSREQHVLGRSGDNCRIDWGYLYLAVPTTGPGGATGAEQVLGSKGETQEYFAGHGHLPLEDDLRSTDSVSRHWPGLAVSLPMPVTATGETQRFVMLAYDDRFSIEYLQRRLPPTSGL